PEESWIDVVVAANAAKEAEGALAAGKLERAKVSAALAASLVRQPFLPGEEGTWVEEKRRQLAEVRGGALSVLADACLRSGDAREAAEWAEQAIALEPFRETGYRRLMEAHAAAGNRAEALRVYERCRRLLADELGAYPSPETESIYRGLLEAPTAPAEALAPPDAAPRANDDAAAGVVEATAGTLRRHRLALAGVALAVVLALASLAVVLTRRGSSAVAVIRPDSVAVIDPSTNTAVADIPLH